MHSQNKTVSRHWRFGTQWDASEGGRVAAVACAACDVAAGMVSGGGGDPAVALRLPPAGGVDGEVTAWGGV